ncbi:MAG: hypothetical protein V1850_05400 [Candidatus Bathyarchaeota archaeon]
MIEKINKLLSRTTQSASAVKHQIEKLDWEIQTNPLSPVEENEIIGQIRLLEKEKLFHNEVAILKARLTELRAELGALRIQNNEIYSQLSELVDKSRENHNKMLEKICEAKPSIDEANNAHRKYLEYEKAANEVHIKYLETIAQIKTADVKIKEIENARYDERLNKEAKAMGEAAYRKVKEKKKLTLDEFKLLKQKGLI